MLPSTRCHGKSPEHDIQNLEDCLPALKSLDAAKFCTFSTLAVLKQSLLTLNRKRYKRHRMQSGGVQISEAPNCDGRTKSLVSLQS